MPPNGTFTSGAPRTATPPAAPAGAPVYVPPAPLQPVQVPPGLLDPPPWSHRILPRTVRTALEALGWWQNPTPQRPSIHLAQTLEALRTYGWCKSLDISPTGRMCIRGAQTMLERAGHVTPQARARAVGYMQHVLADKHGTHTQFFAWNDQAERTFPEVENLLVTAAYRARANGE